MKFNIAHLASCEVLKRVGACVLAFALAFCFVARPVRAEAAIIEGTSALGIAAAQTYFTATGIGLTVIEGGASAGTAAVSAAANSYVAATGVAASGDALLASVGAGVSISAGTLVLSAAAAALLAGFAVWCYSEYLNDTPSTTVALYRGTSLGDLNIGGAVYYTDGTYRVKTLYPGTAFTAFGQSVRLADDCYLLLTTYSGYPAFCFVNAAGDIIPRSGSSITHYYVGPPSGSVDGPSDAYPWFFSWVNLYTPADPFAASGRDGRGIYWDNDANIYKFTQGKPMSGTSWSANISPNVLLAYANASSLDAYDVRIGSSDLGYVAPPEIDDTKQLEIAGLPDVDIAQLPGAVAGQVAAGTLTVSPPVSVPLAPPLPDWDPPLGSGDGGIEEPENPGTENPWLPDDLNVPWHYVVTTLQNAKEFVTLVVSVISVALPTSLQAVVWAAVVLAVLFGLIRRFLG